MDTRHPSSAGQAGASRATLSVCRANPEIGQPHRRQPAGEAKDGHRWSTRWYVHGFQGPPPEAENPWNLEAAP